MHDAVGHQKGLSSLAVSPVQDKAISALAMLCAVRGCYTDVATGCGNMLVGLHMALDIKHV